MIYTSKQRELMRLWQRNQLRRINILEGSVRSGKTWVSLVLWAFWVKTMPEAGLYLMTAKSMTTLKRNCLLPLQDLVGESNFWFSTSAKEAWLFRHHVILEGANDIRSEGKIRGVTLQGAYCDELTQLPEDFFTMLLSRLSEPGAKLIGTTNPDAPSHWLKVNYIDRAAELDFLDVQFLIDDNTTLPADYVDNIKREYTGVFYDRFILGHWTLAEGMIYPMYKDAIAEPPESTPEQDAAAEYTISLDYGTQNAFAALLWRRYDAVWWAVSEYYYSGRDKGVPKTDDQYAQDMDRWLAKITPQKPIKVIIDPSAASFITLLRQKTIGGAGDKTERHRYKVQPADNAVIDGIRETATALQTGLIKVAPACKNWRREAEGYVWDDDPAEDKPVKENDHDMDATRYFVKTMNLVKKHNRPERFSFMR